MKSFLRKSAWLAIGTIASTCDAASLEVTVSNTLPSARGSQTIEVSARDLAPLGAKNLNLVHVKDGSGKEVLCQAIDLDGDELRAFDAVIFQADFAAGETKTFTLGVGAKQVYKKEQFKAFGRFVRERFDDFTWENDLIAHRTYGHALETWKGEPLTSSTIDIWSKRTPRMVISDWYLSDDYHADHGEGADFYSAGLSRGCGGSGLWAEDKLWVSKNFISSNVLANGPIRVLFELRYAPFAVGGAQVEETKRVSLDAGQQFDRFESRYTISGGDNLVAAAGLKKVSGEVVESNPAEGWLAKWEKMEKGAGNQGLAIITAPAGLEKFAEDKLNQLALVKTDKSHVATYWAGFCWDKAGRFTTAEAWKNHVSETAKSLATPLEVKITAAP
ncbi:DUF4861 family protein [Luteolibacter yonseiensis]|uniref:DUF4861 family protein n=1 Tax=Luteolibacter yonseiensis TaxID=1144680 RepID=A0A934R794_9BACT|nr:DUF4861 family protein [Luteolibacter yonseiensis]MBK1817637.1 DUF4861 family protein [Luteolibacter yonseiensis]